MNIIHIYKDYYPVLGGMENHIRQLAQAQAALGHQVTVLVTSTTGHTQRETLDGVRVIKAARQVNVQSAPLSVAFPALVRQETANCDIAHLHAPYPPGEACNLWFGRARRTVITWHSDIVRQKTLLRLYAPVLRKVLRQADCILPTSDAYARSSPWLRDVLEKCVTVPLGVDATRFNATPSNLARAKQIRSELLMHWPPPKPTPLVLLSVGRLRYYKGLDDLIRAMPMLPD
ncbi:MAG TPA: glycosyltransferase, partial [Anaerolineae bacterium]